MEAILDNGYVPLLLLTPFCGPQSALIRYTLTPTLTPIPVSLTLNPDHDPDNADPDPPHLSGDASLQYPDPFTPLPPKNERTSN